MLSIARPLHEAGFGVFLYDTRGHGASDDGGPITLRKFAEDLIAAIDYLEERPEVDITRLGIVAHSMGGSGAILASSMEPRIQALVTSSAFADPADITRIIMCRHHLPHWPFFWLLNYFFGRWLGTTIADIAPQNRIGQITVPLLLIHGASDQFISPTNLETLYTRAQQEYVQRWLVPGRRHSDIIPDPEYGSRVIKFLSKHLLSEKQQVRAT
jgi:pimeloyl-ACP methyl ester carboxylesterase